MNPEEFWNKDEEHQDQKFYVCFCMLESALGDFAIAQDTHSHNKLSWASIIYYYALVHAMRLICFIVNGDFPIGHSTLAKLYKEDSINNPKCWLNIFIKDNDNPIELEQIELTRENIVNFFNGDKQLSISLNNNILKRWGNFLDKARVCRNNSNYEGLIIAHEFGHRIVSSDLKSLTDVFFRECNIILPKIILMFKSFIDRHKRKEYWYSFLNWEDRPEGIYYFERNMRFRLLGILPEKYIEISDQKSNLIFDIEKCRTILNNILELLNPLKIETVNYKFAEIVFNNIKLGNFDSKESLMQNFRNKINELSRI